MRASLPLSAAGHAAIIGALLLLPVAMPSPPKVDLTHAVEIVFAPPPAPTPPPQPVVQPQPAVEPPPQPVAEPPPPPVIEQPPLPPAAQAETPPPPPPKPAPKPKPRPQPVERPTEMPLPVPAQPTAPAAAPPQVASLPPPSLAPVVTADYRALLSSWLESHKRYPEEARQRGEEGRAVLRFRVNRMGRVLDYSVVSSTGFADLDAAIDAMMRGASMPAFPQSMSAPEIEVSVTIRFGLSR